MPHKAFKDHPGALQSQASAPQRSTESSDKFDGEIEHTPTPARKSVQRSQVYDSATPLTDISYIQYRRIVASLEEGHGEKNIAESERISERVVRRVRAAELDRLKRQMSAVSVSFGGFLENVRQLHGDIDKAVFEELRERVA